LTEGECATETRERNQHSGIKPDESPAKWSGGTGVPGPCVSLINSDETFEHRQMSPAPSEGIDPFRDFDQGARRRAATGRRHDKQVAAPVTPAAKPSDAPRFVVTNQEGERSRLATESYYCEPVWGPQLRRFWTRNRPPKRPGVATGE
jgi:hypothetical protein